MAGNRDSNETLDRITCEIEPSSATEIVRVHVLYIVEGPDAGRVHRLEQEQTIIGRGPECEIILSEEGVSRRHARCLRMTDGLWIEDLGSRNGTHVNNGRLDQPRRLFPGDRLAIGAVRLRYSLEDEAELERVQELQVAAVHDHLTGLHNRRYFEKRLQTEFAYCVRHRASLALLLLDLDRFKSVNDRYGHPAGDAVLSGVARAIAGELRTEDVAARYGGEELAIIARGTGMAGALALAERLLTRVRGLSIPTGGRALRVTASIGAAALEVGTGFTTPSQLVQGADAALFTAKREGRDCARVYHTPSSSGDEIGPPDPERRKK